MSPSWSSLALTHRTSHKCMEAISKEGQLVGRGSELKCGAVYLQAFQRAAGTCCTHGQPVEVQISPEGLELLAGNEREWLIWHEGSKLGTDHVFLNTCMVLVHKVSSGLDTNALTDFLKTQLGTNFGLPKDPQDMFRWSDSSGTSLEQLLEEVFDLDGPPGEDEEPQPGGRHGPKVHTHVALTAPDGRGNSVLPLEVVAAGSKDSCDARRDLAHVKAKLRSREEELKAAVLREKEARAVGAGEVKRHGETRLELKKARDKTRELRLMNEMLKRVTRAPELTLSEGKLRAEVAEHAVTKQQLQDALEEVANAREQLKGTSKGAAAEGAGTCQQLKEEDTKGVTGEPLEDILEEPAVEGAATDELDAVDGASVYSVHLTLDAA